MMMLLFALFSRMQRSRGGSTVVENDPSGLILFFLLTNHSISLKLKGIY